MATEIADWSANDLENIRLDEINLSREQGEEVAKLMGAIKRKFNAVDAAISGGGGGEWRWNPVPAYTHVFDGTEQFPEYGPTVEVGDVLAKAALYTIKSPTMSSSQTANIGVTVMLKIDGQDYSFWNPVVVPNAQDASHNMKLCAMLKPENGIYFVTAWNSEQVVRKAPLVDNYGSFVFASDNVFVGDCVFLNDEFISSNTVAKLYIPEED